jgi:hypothetical protein
MPEHVSKERKFRGRNNLNNSTCVPLQLWYCELCAALMRLFFDILQRDLSVLSGE